MFLVLFDGVRINLFIIFLEDYEKIYFFSRFVWNNQDYSYTIIPLKDVFNDLVG